MTERELKALEISAKAKLQRSGDRWFVPSQTKGKGGDYYYTVKPDPIQPHCTCPDLSLGSHCDWKHELAENDS